MAQESPGFKSSGQLRHFDFACFPYACVGSLQTLQLSPKVQRHMCAWIRLIGKNKFIQAILCLLLHDSWNRLDRWMDFNCISRQLQVWRIPHFLRCFMGVIPLSTVIPSFRFLGTIILKHNKSHYQSDIQLHVLLCLDNLKSLKDALMISRTQYFRTFSNSNK